MFAWLDRAIVAVVVVTTCVYSFFGLNLIAPTTGTTNTRRTSNQDYVANSLINDRGSGDGSILTNPLQFTGEDFRLFSGPKPTLTKDDVIYDKVRNTAPIVNEEYKVIFFHVAKAASSEWLRFFTRLEGSPEWCDGNIHEHNHNTLTDYTLADAQRMMTDPTWTRAIFVRNPKERLLSAFLDKVLAHKSIFRNSECPTYKKKGGSLDDCLKYYTDFGFFLRNFTTYTQENVHWRPIYSRIDEKWWPYINYVGNMEHLSEDARHFLHSIRSTKNDVSAWDHMGKKGWSDNEKSCDVSGEGSTFLEKKDTHHKTNAEDKMRMYYTPELERFIELTYWKDYYNPYFHFTPLKLFPGNDFKNKSESDDKDESDSR